MQYLINHVCDDEVRIDTVGEENLLAMGWIIFSGIEWGTVSEDGYNTYTGTAKMFRDIITDYNALQEKG